MPETETAMTDRLIAEVKEAEASERNQARLRSQARPRLNVEIEDPIAWVSLFRFEPGRYFSDPAFFLAQYLRQKLWRFRSINDDVPINSFVPAWLGHYPEYTFFGMTLGYQPHGGPLLDTAHAMTRDPNMALLEPVDFRTSGWMPRMLRFYEELVTLAEGRLSIGFFVWNRGCVDLAIQLRGYENWLMDTLERPAFAHELLTFLVEQRNAWHDARAEYLGIGLEPTWVADDWVAVPYVSPSIFTDFVLPRYLQIEAHHGVFGGFHSCGDQAPFHRDLLRIRTLRGFEVGPWMKLSEALANLPADKPLHIAVHPNDVLVDSAEEMKRKHDERAALLCGTSRTLGLGTSGLTPIRGETDFVERADRWLDIARSAFATTGSANGGCR